MFPIRSFPSFCHTDKFQALIQLKDPTNAAQAKTVSSIVILNE